MPLPRGRLISVFRRLLEPALRTAALVSCLVAFTSACSDGAADRSTDDAALSTAPTTNEPLFSRQVENPVDPNVTPTTAETAPPPPPTPIVHVLGGIAALVDGSPAWQANVPVVDGDVATIASLVCNPAEDATCSPDLIAAWASGGVEVVNVATAAAGVATDLGTSVEALRASGVEAVGYGSDQADAVSGITLERDNATISVHAISLVIDPDAAAAQDRPGVAGPDAYDDLVAVVEERRNEGAAIIVIVDIGAADDRAPTAEQIEQVQRLIEIDADAIVGTGSDYLQRFDRVANSTVAYSLGHTATATDDPLRTDTAVLRLEFANPGRACLLPATGSATGPALDDPTITSCVE